MNKQQAIRAVADKYGFDVDSSPKEIIAKVADDHKIEVTNNDVGNWKTQMKAKDGKPAGKPGRKKKEDSPGFFDDVKEAASPARATPSTSKPSIPSAPGIVCLENSPYQKHIRDLEATFALIEQVGGVSEVKELIKYAEGVVAREEKERA